MMKVGSAVRGLAGGNEGVENSEELQVRGTRGSSAVDFGVEEQRTGLKVVFGGRWRGKIVKWE